MVMAVSLVSSGRRAVVSSVSRGQCECVVMALNVLISSSCRAGREKVRPAALFQRESAKKFAPHAQNGRKTLFSGALGELFRGNAAGGAALGELFRG